MSTPVHSSLLGRYQPIPRTVLGRTRADEKAARDAQDAKAERECYRAVDKRDGLRCRVSGVLLSLRGGLVKGVQRHHLQKRSQQGEHFTWNVITVSSAVHDRIHVHGTLRLEGDADARDAEGRLCGVAVMVPTEAGWVVERWV